MATVIQIGAFQPNLNHPCRFGPTPNFNDIPEDLRRSGRWCVWYARQRKGTTDKYDKVPSNGRHGISVAKPDDWLTFDQVRQIYERNPSSFNGVGRLVDNRYIIADVDNSDQLPRGWPSTYTEVSPSGKGLRLVWRTEVLPPCDLARPAEIYAGYAPRFVTFTGHPVLLNGVVEPIRGSGQAIARWVEQHRVRGLEPEESSADKPDLVDPENLPSPMTLGMPHWAQALLYDCEVDPSAPGRDLSRSGVLLSAAVWFYTHTTLTDGEVLTYLQESPGSSRIALDHRRGSEDKALDYLWATCCKARLRRPPPAEDDFIPLDEGEWARGEDENSTQEGSDGKQTKEDTPKQRRGFELVLAQDLLKQPKPLRWLIKHWALPESQVLLFGDPVTGKSLVALDWAACVAIGLDWHGSPVNQGPVVYIAGEGHFGIRRRLKAWAIARDCEDELAQAPLAVSSMGTALIEPASKGEVIKAIDAFAKQYGRPKMIVIDTIHRNLGGDENSSEDMGRYFRAGDILRDRYKAAVVHVHHSGHGDKDRGRGSSAIRGSIDTELLMQLDANTGIRTLSCPVKMKDAPRPAPIAFELLPVELPWADADGDPESSVVLVPAQAQTGIAGSARTFSGKRASPTVRFAFETLLAALEARGEAPPKGWPFAEGVGERAVGLADWREEFYARHTGDSVEVKRQAFHRARGALVAGKAAVVWGDWYAPSAGIDCEWGDLEHREDLHPKGEVAKEQEECW